MTTSEQLQIAKEALEKISKTATFYHTRKVAADALSRISSMPDEPEEEDAIAFAEWIDKVGFFCYYDSGNLRWENVNTELKDFTTIQLYAFFRKRIN